MLRIMAYLFSLQLTSCFSPFREDFKSEFLIQDLISRLIVNENGTSTYRSVSLSVDSQKQIKFRILKMWLSFNGFVYGLICPCYGSNLFAKYKGTKYGSHF